VDEHDLADLPLFGGLSRKERKRIAGWTDDVDLPEGYHLLNEGAFPYEFYVILDGEVAVTHGGEQLATLGRGAIVGEIAILEHERRTATVVAATPCRVAVMTKAAFDEMRREMPAVADSIERTARGRLSR